MKTFLNLTSFSPQMAFVVCSFLERCDGEATESVVRSWLAPPTLFKQGRPPEDWGYPLALDVAEHLEFIERRNDQLKLLVEFGNSISRFRAAARARVMEKASQSFDNTDDPVDELAKALTWWLHQPTQAWSSTNFEPLMEGLPFKPILQPTRWNVFERWAPFLGFAWRLGDALIPDPTAALMDVVDAVLPPGDAVDAPRFLAMTGVQLPVVDGGAAFNGYRNAVGLPWPTDVLEAPLSLALLRLERRGEIEFPVLRDAEGVTIRCGSIERRVSQIRRTAGSGSRSES